MYGLVDAARRWWISLNDDLIRQGCERSKYDQAFYIFKNKNGDLAGIICCHVDDLCYAGTAEFHKLIIEGVVSKFTVGRLEAESFTFTGWNLKQDLDGIILTQDSYNDKINMQDFSVLEFGKVDNTRILNTMEQTVFRKAVGTGHSGQSSQSRQNGESGQSMQSGQSGQSGNWA